MFIDWETAIRIGVPIATTVIAAIIATVLKERPRLIVFVSHASAFEVGSNWQLLRVPGDPEDFGAPSASGGEPADAKSEPAGAVTTDTQADTKSESAETPSSATSAKPAAEPPANPTKFYVNSHSIFIKNVGRKTAMNVRISHSARPYSVQIYPAFSYELLKGQGYAWEMLVPTLVPNEAVQLAYLYHSQTRWQDFDTNVKSDECTANSQNVAPVPMDTKPKRYAKRAALYLGIAAAAYLVVRAGEWLYRVNACLGTCS